MTPPSDHPAMPKNVRFADEADSQPAKKRRKKVTYEDDEDNDLEASNNNAMDMHGGSGRQIKGNLTKNLTNYPNSDEPDIADDEDGTDMDQFKKASNDDDDDDDEAPGDHDKMMDAVKGEEKVRERLRGRAAQAGLQHNRIIG